MSLSEGTEKAPLFPFVHFPLASFSRVPLFSLFLHFPPFLYILPPSIFLLLSLSAPLLVPSNAPLGGFTPALRLIHAGSADITLWGFDTDTFTEDTFNLGVYLVTDPLHGSLRLKGASLSSPAVTASSTQASPLAPGSVLTFYAENGGGGVPYATFAYVARDSQGSVSYPAVVTLNVQCPPGSHVVQDGATCNACPPGRYAVNASFDLECAR